MTLDNVEKLCADCAHCRIYSNCDRKAQHTLSRCARNDFPSPVIPNYIVADDLYCAIERKYTCNNSCGPNAKYFIRSIEK